MEKETFASLFYIGSFHGSPLTQHYFLLCKLTIYTQGYVNCYCIFHPPLKTGFPNCFQFTMLPFCSQSPEHFWLPMPAQKHPLFRLPWLPRRYTIPGFLCLSSLSSMGLFPTFWIWTSLRSSLALCTSIVSAFIQLNCTCYQSIRNDDGSRHGPYFQETYIHLTEEDKR